MVVQRQVGREHRLGLAGKDGVGPRQDPPGHFGSTHHSPAHKNHVTGEVCHCPWGPQRDLWSFTSAWDDDDDWDGWEPSDEALEAAEAIPPYNGDLGKGLMSPDLDELLIWGVDEHGIPHHDVVSQEEGFPFAAKLDIMANRVVIGSPDEATLFGVDRATAEEALRRLAPQYGLVFSNRFFAKRHEDRQPVRIDPEGPQAVRAVVRGVPVKASPGQRTPVERHAAEGPVGPVVNEVERHPPIIAEKVRTCPTCGDALQGEHGTFCPRCQWSEHNPNLDGDPRDNPPDPFEDLNKGIIPRVAASHRWAGKWFEAAS